MPSLIGFGNGLLGYGNGLAGNSACCCYPPPGCPPCCLEILDGVFNEDGDLEIIQAGAGGVYILVTITMPTKFSRYVCDEEQITITWEIFNRTTTGSPHAFINFGPAWKFIYATPAVDSDNDELGIYQLGGTLEWPDSESTIYEVTLEYSKCFANNAFDFGDIILGMYNPLLEVFIDTRFCMTGVSRCCDDDETCSPCCVILGEAYYYAETDTTIYIDKKDNWVLMASVNKRKVCLNDTVGIAIKIIPKKLVRPGDTPYLPRLTINHLGWIRSAYTPGLGPGGTEEDDSIYWGDLENVLDYTIDLGFDCQFDEETLEPIYPEDITILSLPPADSGYPGLTVGIPVTLCDMEGCCTPPPCNCCFCYTPPVGTDGVLVTASGTIQIPNCGQSTVSLSQNSKFVRSSNFIGGSCAQSDSQTAGGGGAYLIGWSWSIECNNTHDPITGATGTLLEGITIPPCTVKARLKLSYLCINQQGGGSGSLTFEATGDSEDCELIASGPALEDNSVTGLTISFTKV